MAKTIVLWLVGFLSLSISAEAQNFDFSELRVQDRTVPQIVEILRAKFRIPVCLESIPVDAKDAVTVGYALDDLAKRPVAELSSADKRYVDLAKQLKAKFPDMPASHVIDYRRPRLSLDIKPHVGLQSLLEAVVKADPSYQMERSNGTFILRPNSPRLIKYAPVSLTISNATIADAYDALVKAVLSPNNLVLYSDVDSLPYRQSAMRLSLHLESVDPVEALTRFVQSLGPDVGWSLTRINGHGSVDIFRVGSGGPEKTGP